MRLSKLKEKVAALEQEKAKEEEGKNDELHDYGNEEEKKEWMEAKTQRHYSKKDHRDRSRSRSHNRSSSRSNHHHHRHHRHHNH